MKMVFHKDPCGIFCILLTYGLVIYADYVVLQHVIAVTLLESFWGPLHAVLFNTLVVILLFAHSKTVFSDPGAVPLPSRRLDFSDLHLNHSQKRKDQSTNEEDWTVCQRCQTYRPPRAHHCKVCRRCIRRMDHHCPWVNNCIGELNQKHFIQFLFYTEILCLYALCLDIANWVWMFGNNRTSNHDLLSRKSTVAHSIGLAIESLLFSIFILVMLHDQVTAIFGDETAVEHVIHKNRKLKLPRARKPRIALLREVFGHGPIYCWLFPCISLNRTVHSASSYSYNV